MTISKPFKSKDTVKYTNLIGPCARLKLQIGDSKMWKVEDRDRKTPWKLSQDFRAMRWL